MAMSDDGLISDNDGLEDGGAREHSDDPARPGIRWHRD
jgi:hypothetical protein